MGWRIATPPMYISCAIFFVGLHKIYTTLPALHTPSNPPADSPAADKAPLCFWCLHLPRSAGAATCFPVSTFLFGFYTWIFLRPPAFSRACHIPSAYKSPRIYYTTAHTPFQVYNIYIFLGSRLWTLPIDYTPYRVYNIDSGLGTTVP